MKGAGVNDAEIAVLNLDTGKHEVLFKGAEGRYVAPGFIVFFRAGAYHAVRFDASTLKTSGGPVRVLDDAYGNSPEGDISETDLNAAGTLSYLSGPNTHVRQLTWISAGGKSEPLPFPARALHRRVDNRRRQARSRQPGRCGPASDSRTRIWIEPWRRGPRPSRLELVAGLAPGRQASRVSIHAEG